MADSGRLDLQRLAGSGRLDLQRQAAMQRHATVYNHGMQRHATVYNHGMQRHATVYNHGMQRYTAMVCDGIPWRRCPGGTPAMEKFTPLQWKSSAPAAPLQWKSSPPCSGKVQNRAVSIAKRRELRSLPGKIFDAHSGMF